jgi:hypothetical protein
MIFKSSVIINKLYHHTEQTLTHLAILSLILLQLQFSINSTKLYFQPPFIFSGTIATAATVESVTLTAAAGATAATASVSATNASINDSGNFFGSLNDVTKVTLKETTSKESLKNAAGAVVGEVVGSSLRSSVENGTITKDTAVQIAGLAGAAAGLTASIALGQDDEKTANGVWAGSREGGIRRGRMRC